MRKLCNKYKTVALVGALVLGMLVFSGCNAEDAANVAEAVADEVTLDEETLDAAAELLDISSFTSAEDFVEAINSLGVSEEDLLKKAEIYGVYEKKFQLSETEYIDYAEICGLIGDSQKQRDLLWMLYRLDPTEEHGELISKSVYVVDDSSAQADVLKELITKLEEATESSDSEADLDYINELFTSAKWIDNFFLDTGIYTSHTRVEGEYEVDVFSDQIHNVVIVNKDNRMLGVKSSAVGSSVFSCGAADSDYSGSFYVAEYDELGNIIKTQKGTIDNGHCIDEFSIVISGTEYIGHFDKNGLTTETQPEKLEGVVYAYDKDGMNYLYAADEDPSSWNADIEFIGLKGIEE